jgi:signal peptidase I
MTKKDISSIPDIPELERELKRERYKHRYKKTLRSTIYALITVAAAAILVATLWLPVLEIYGNSMSPTLENGQIVLSLKSAEMRSGQVVAFYYNNKILVKRVIAQSGDWVNVDPDGNVYVNGALLDEPYLTEKALGECNIELPYQVPEDHVFVMGDHRSTSIDSRNTAVGCVSGDQIVGRLVMCIWPIADFGTIQ